MNDASALFDRYSAAYDQALSKAIAPSGESREYFARGRVGWLKRCLNRVGTNPGTLLDFGCGDGATTSPLLTMLGVESATGVDVSAKSLEVARRRYATGQIKYVAVCV